MHLKALSATLSPVHNLSRYQSIRLVSSTTEQIKPFKDIPGLSTLPIIGPAHHFLPWIGTIGPKGNFFELMDVFYKKFGPVVRLEGVIARASMLILFDPAHFEQVYRAEESYPLRPGFETKDYYHGVLRKDRFGGYYGLTSALVPTFNTFIAKNPLGGSFCMKFGGLGNESVKKIIIGQGPQWRDFRTKVNPALLKPKLVKLYSPGLGEISEEMVARLVKLSNEGDYLEQNFDLEMTKWALESVALVALGARLDCLRDHLAGDHPARQLLQCAKDIIDISFKLEFFPSLWKYYATPKFKKLMKTYDLQWDVSAMYIEQAKKFINEREHDVPEEDRSIIEKLISIDERVAVLMANEMLMAGIDTVAFTITSVLYHLARNEGAQNKLREEVRAGESRRFLRACVKEALRTWAVLPANLRRTARGHVVAGYRLPAGIDVIAPNEYLSNMDEHYPRAAEFLPERWLVEKTDPLYHGNAHPMVNAPFGIGVRSCIGRRIAELEIEVFLTKLIDKQKVKWNGPPIKVVSKLMNTFAKPYHFKFESAA